MTKQMIATKRSFINGVLVEAGFPAAVPEGLKVGDNLTEAGDYRPSVVQNAAIAPTGPNPTAPQHIGPDTIQTIGGYAKPGARVVGEVTAPAETHIEAEGLDQEQSGEAQIADLMSEANSSTQNNDDALVAGTVSEITADLGAKTDEQLQQLRAAEVDREKPRKGVIDAIDAELKNRSGGSES